MSDYCFDDEKAPHSVEEEHGEATPTKSTGAERMRRHRKRRRQGLRSYQIDLLEAEVDELVRKILEQDKAARLLLGRRGVPCVSRSRIFAEMTRNASDWIVHAMPHGTA
jgi:hypothetical protein